MIDVGKGDSNGKVIEGVTKKENEEKKRRKEENVWGEC